MPISDLIRGIRPTTFAVEDGDFSNLEIRESGRGNGLHYFFDTAARTLVTDFVLEERARVVTLANVTLIEKGGRYTPRLRLWKMDRTKAGKRIAEERIDSSKSPVIVTIKASVDTNDCYVNFWKLIGFLEGFSQVDTVHGTFRVVESDDVELVELLKTKDKESILKAVIAAVGGQLSEDDLELLAGRKSELRHFEQLLSRDGFFEAEKARLGISKDEAVWQRFFEMNCWIFGYGLKLVACDSLDSERLEQITTGAGIFTGAGKRSDAVMRTRGYISSLLFCEIKTPGTLLLKNAPYRRPDVYQVSDELSGGVSQVQKTAQKATRTLAAYMDKIYQGDGTPLRVELSTIKPRQVLLIGNQKQLADDGGVNLEKSLSFELYRKSITEVEILTFDELLERARFIVGDSDARDG